MDQKDSITLQKNIRNNAEELQDFLNDLKSWEKEIKAVDESLSEKARENITNNDIPPVRCKEKLETTSSNPTKKNANADNKKKKSDAEKKERIKSSDYAAWDKFDPDKALESDDNDSTSKPSSKKPNKQERATALKEEGNKFYSSGRLDDAIAKYTQAIGLDPTNPILPANRAMAYIKIEKYTAAEADCCKALKLDPVYVKALLRRGTSRTQLKKLELAAGDFRKVLELEPWNKEAKKELEKIDRMMDKKPKGKQIEKSETKKSSSTTGNKSDAANSTVAKETAEKKATNSSTVNDKAASGGQNNRPGIKKLKIEEINSNTKKKEDTHDPDSVYPIEKAPHLRSMKPLKRISVVDVPTYEAITSSEDGNTKIKLSSPPPVKVPEKEVPKESPKESVSSPVVITQVPSPPKTSNQFSQDWSRLSHQQSCAIEYLKKIPTSFFCSLDLEPDTLVDVLKVLCVDDITPAEAATYLAALAKSSGFSVNVMFFDGPQKKVLEDVVARCESDENFTKQMKEIRAMVQ